jgi:hypothetical protein
MTDLPTMTAKQLGNAIALARLGFARIAGEQQQSVEALAEIACDLVAVKVYADALLRTEAAP